MRTVIALRNFVAATLLIAAPASCWAASGLSSYQARITYLDEYHALVTAHFTISDATPHEAARLVRYPGQQFSDWRPAQLGFPVTTASGGTNLALTPDAAGVYSLSYKVASSDTLTHVPLPVPDSLPASRKHFVQVAVSTPSGTVVYDDAFPQKTWTDATHGLATLPAVPSIVAVKFAPAAQIRWFTHWKSVSRLSTVCMFLILVGGSAVLYLRRRPSPKEVESKV